MKQNDKIIFIVLCIMMWAVNGYFSAAHRTSLVIATFVGGGFGASLISIPLWAAIGIVLANIALFFRNIIKPTENETLNMWHKASIGLVAGIVLKVLFGMKVP